MQQGKDIVYETFFILWMQLPVKPSIGVAWTGAVAVGGFSDLISFGLDAVNNYNNPGSIDNIYRNFALNLLIDGVFAPTISTGTFCYLKKFHPEIDDFHKSTAMIMTTLVFRHLLKKWLPCYSVDMIESRRRERQHLLHSGNTPQLRRLSYLSVEDNHDDSDHTRQNNKENSGYNSRSNRRNLCEKVLGFIHGFFHYKSHPTKTSLHEANRERNVAQFLSTVQMSPRRRY